MDNSTQRQRRAIRSRAAVHGTAARPRLAIQKTAKHFRAQLINDDAGTTLVSVTDEQADPKTTGRTQAEAVGTLLGKTMKKENITQAVLDRRGHKYHGRVQSFADAVRATGVKI